MSITNKKSLRKLFIVLAFLLVIITLYEIADTYAIFYNQSVGIVTKPIGKWNISVNGDMISSGAPQEFVIDNFTVVGNSHTETGKFAPGMTGSFEICIDPTDTDVSVGYAMDIDTTNIEDNNIDIVSVEEVEYNTSLVESIGDVYAGVIPLSDIALGKTHTIRVTFNWLNDDNDSTHDTALQATNGAILEIPVAITFSQYLGE